LSLDKFFWEKFMKRSGAALKKLARFALVEVGGGKRKAERLKTGGEQAI
jgi:hypothetical protein